jgi:hypothetical protein
MGVTPLKLYILKRKLFFILQLLVNKATNELITLGVHRTLRDVLDIIGVKDEDLALGRDRYEGIVRSLVVKKLEEIDLKKIVIPYNICWIRVGVAGVEREVLTKVYNWL